MAGIIGRNETLFLAQLLYWTDWLERNEPSREEWIYKDSKEIQEETTLTYREQSTAREHLIELGILEEITKKLEHVVYFRVKQEALDKLIDRHIGVDIDVERTCHTTQTQSDIDVERT